MSDKTYLATATEMEGATGRSFFHGRPSRNKPVTYNTEIAARLWSVSEGRTRAGEHIAREAIR